MHTDEKTDVSNSGQAAMPTVAHAFAEIVWLLTRSPQHRHLFVADLEWLVMTPMLLNQFRVFRRPDGAAVGVALWAYLSEESEQLLDGGLGRLRPQDWKSGDRLWLVDLIAPNGGADEMLKDLQQSVFVGRTFKFHRTRPDGKREVVEAAPKVTTASTLASDLLQ